MIEKLFNIRNETSTLSTPQSWLTDLLGGQSTSSGETIGNIDSLDIGIVFSCAERRANAVAKLPIHVFKNTATGREREYNDAVVRLLETRPNIYVTPSVFKHTLSVHQDLWGNAYIWIETDKRKGTPIALWILDPSSTTVEKNTTTGVITYKAYLNNTIYVFNSSEIIHLKGLSTDGIIGKSRISVARETLGNMKASSKFIGKFYQNGTMSGAVLTYPEELGKEAKDNIKASWQENYGGLDQAGKIAVLDRGLDYKSLGMPLKDAEFIASSKFNKDEIAMIFNVPPHKVGSMDGATFSNIEQQSMDFIQDSIQPVITQWEEEFNYKLFTSNSGLYIKFNLGSAMRADSINRSLFYEKMQNIGVYSINEIRSFEDMNGLGEIGDKHYRSLNFVDIEKADEYQLSKAGVNNTQNSTGGGK